MLIATTLILISSLQSVGVCGDRSGERIDLLIRALERDDPVERALAAGDLEELGSAAEPAIPALIADLRDTRPTAFGTVSSCCSRALQSIGPAAVPMLNDALEDAQKETRAAAALTLMSLAPYADETVPALAKALTDSDASVRENAARALGRIGDKADSAVTQILTLLRDDPSPRVRWHCAEAAEHIAGADKRVISALESALGDNDANVRGAAARALGRLGPAAQATVPALILALRDDDFRWEAVGADAFGLLPVRRDAAEALGRIGRPAKDALPDLWRLAEHDNSAPVRVRAAQAIVRIDPTSNRAWKTLLFELHRGDSGTAGPVEAANVLGELGAGARPAAPHLIRALDHQEQRVGSAAAEALGAIGGEAAYEALVAASVKKRGRVRISAVTGLGKIGPRAIPALCNALEDSNPYVRREAARALGNIGPEARQAAPELIKALKDDQVRKAAQWALDRIGIQPTVSP